MRVVNQMYHFCFLNKRLNSTLPLCYVFSIAKKHDEIFLKGDFSSHHFSPWHTDWTFGCRWFPFVEICRESSQDRNRYLKQSMLYTQPCNDTNYSGRMFNIYTLENKHGTQKWRFGIWISFSTEGFLGSTEISSPLGGRWSNFSSHHHLPQLHVPRSFPGEALNSSGSSWW